MKRFIAAALAAGCLVSSTPVFSADADAGSFDKWLSPDAPECVPVSAIKSAATVTELTPEQFQFARALHSGSANLAKTASGRSCDHGKLRRRRDGRACRRRAGLCAVSRPRFHQNDAG